MIITFITLKHNFNSELVTFFVSMNFGKYLHLYSIQTQGEIYDFEHNNSECNWVKFLLLLNATPKQSMVLSNSVCICNFTCKHSFHSDKAFYFCHMPWKESVLQFIFKWILCFYICNDTGYKSYWLQLRITYKA